MPIDPTKSYDENNIFAKILRGELPCKKVYENDHLIRGELRSFEG